MKTLIEKLLHLFWSWRLRRIKNATHIIGTHCYPPDTQTGWKRMRSDYRTIKAMAKVTEDLPYDDLNL